MADQPILPMNASAELEAAIPDIRDLACSNINRRSRSAIASLERDTHTSGINEGEYKVSYQNVDAAIATMLKSVVEMYGMVSYIKNIVDMMGDFAAEGVQIVHKNKSVDDFYKKWGKKVKIKSRSNTFMTEFYKSANVIIWRVDGNVNGKTLPVAYRVINPRAVKMEGDEMFGNRKFWVSDSGTISLSTDTSDPEVVKQLRKSGSRSGGWIELPADKVYTMQYKKDDWNKWALPLLYPVVDDVNFKLKLREMDKAAMDSIINVITLFKIGSDKFPPTAALFKKMAGIISGSSPSMNLLWDNNLEVEHKHLPVQDVLGAEKYNQINLDILNGIGVPSILVGGDGANFSTSFIQVKTLVERLKNGQDFLVDFWEREAAYVADQLGFRTYPEVRIDAMSLRDEIQEKKIILSMVDRGIMSAETALRYFNEDIVVETERMGRERELQKQGLLEKKSPFDKNIAGSPLPGRPPGTNTPQEKIREEKPDGMGSVAGDIIDPIVAEEIDEVSKIIQDINADTQTEGPAKLDRCTREVYKQLVDKYKKQNGKSPSKETKKDLKSKSWAICTKSLACPIVTTEEPSDDNE